MNYSVRLYPHTKQSAKKLVVANLEMESEGRKIVIRGIQLCKNKNGDTYLIFPGMWSEAEHGKHLDSVHPGNIKTRAEIMEEILKKYYEERKAGKWI